MLDEFTITHKLVGLLVSGTLKSMDRSVSRRLLTCQVGQVYVTRQLLGASAVTAPISEATLAASL